MYLDSETSPIEKLPSSPLGYVSSPIGVIQVYGYTPGEGEQGVLLTANINLRYSGVGAIHIRLVVGRKAIPTVVRESANTSYGAWRLEGVVPPLDKHSRVHELPISVQALNSDLMVIDTVTFGNFKYWASENLSSPHTVCISYPPSPSSYRQRRQRLHRRNKPCPLRRAVHYAPGEVLATLEFVTPLTDVCRDWDPAEINAGRRLVRFCSIQEGRRLIVSCGPITQEDYHPSDNVVSCIYREDVDDYFITSVDIIHLLQRLVGEDFAVMEKNRIRRNLEGLHPITISKNREGVESFFQRIMDFPEPRPRNIEKDLKVFLWSLLPQALEKIVSKYSLYTVEQDDTSQPEFSPGYAESVTVSETIQSELSPVSPLALEGCYNYLVSPTTSCSTTGMDYFGFLGDSSTDHSWMSNLELSDKEPALKVESPVYENVFDLTAFDMLELQSIRGNCEFSDFLV